MKQFDAKTEGESMENQKTTLRRITVFGVIWPI